MIGWKLTRADCGSITPYHERVYYREGEQFMAPPHSVGCYIGCTLKGVTTGGFGPRLVAIKYLESDDMGGGSGVHDNAVRRVRRGWVLPQWPADRPNWTVVWTPPGPSDETDMIRRLMKVGDEESLMLVEYWESNGSPYRIKAIQRLHALRYPKEIPPK